MISCSSGSGVVEQSERPYSVFWYCTVMVISCLPRSSVSLRHCVPSGKGLGEFGVIVQGTPVYGELFRASHLITEGFRPDLPVFVSWDFGLTRPAVSWHQMLPKGKWRIWGEVMEGVRYVRKDSLQWALFVLIFPAYLVGSGLNALQTPLAKGVVGISDREFGIFNSVWGAGFLAASLLLGWYGRSLSRTFLIVGGFFAQFVLTWMMGFSKSYPGLLVTGFGVGFTNTLSFVGLSTLLMEYTPSNLMGRVVSTRQMALHMVRIASPLIFGSLADDVGVSTAIFLMTLVGAVGTAVIATTLVPLLRRIDSMGPPRQEQTAFGRHVLGGLDLSLDQTAQIRLNYTSITIVVVAWFYLALTHTSEAFWVISSIAAIAYLGGLARHRGLLP